MAEYEIYSALQKKVDKWEVQNLQNELSQCKRDLQHYRDGVAKANGRIELQYTTISNLISLLMEKEIFAQDQDILFNLKQYL